MKPIRKKIAAIYERIKFIKNDSTVARLKEKGLVTVGKHTYGKVVVDNYEGSETKLEIGSYCSIANDVRFITGGIHPVDWVSLYPFRIKWHMEGAYTDGMPTSNGPIIVGHDVWIGIGVTVLSGVSIGNGAIIMAGSIVTKNVAPYSIVGGIPAKEKSKRFSQETIEKLQEIAWWNWDEEKIKKHIDQISSNRVEEFVKAYWKK